MADNNTQTPVGGDASANEAPQAGMLGQYIKDLSFENPNAPASIQVSQGARPQIDVSVNVGVRRANEEVFEVELKLSATSKVTPEGQAEMAAFVVELSYCALFGIRNVPEDQVRAFLLIQAPNLMFPYARRIISDATRDGGFSPLMLEPINFEALYRQQEAQQQTPDINLDDAPQPTNLN